MSSLFTPNIRFTEVVEDGISGGNVVPADFQPTPEGLEQVRENILKAGIVGRLVANDFSGAIISAQLLEFNPNTGEPLDYIEVAERARGEDPPALPGERLDVVVETSPVDVHMIGFAKVIGDISDGATRVLLFFAIAFLITAIFVYVYSQSIRLTIVPLACSLIAVIWQLGLLTAARLRHRPDGHPGAVPDLRHRRQPRRADGQRRPRRGLSTAPTTWPPRAPPSAACWFPAPSPWSATPSASSPSC